MLLSSRWRNSPEARRTLWAVADQCAVSGGNFATNLILLRVLLPIEYGTYALVLNSIIFCNSIQQALISYPLCVRGAGVRLVLFRRILAFALLGTTVLLCTVLGPPLIAVGLSLGPAVAIGASVLAMWLWQLQSTLRSGFIAILDQRRALTGDAISYGGQALVLGLACLRGRPSLLVIFSIIAGTSLLASLVQTWQLSPTPPPRRMLRPLAWHFWNLGYWNVVASLLGFFTLQAFPWLILMGHGRIEVAAFGALFQFLAFSNPLLFSLGSLITATVARGGDYRSKSVRTYLFVTCGIMACYLLLLAGAGPTLMRWLYGRFSPYLPYAPVIRVFAAAWVFEVIALLAMAVLGGLRRPRSLFVIQLFGAAAAALIALPLTYWIGLLAAGIGLIVVNGVRAATGVILILRHKGGRSRGDLSNPIDAGDAGVPRSIL